MSQKENKPLKVVAIVGPTAAGKSAWAIRLAHSFNGVVLSADSRQVYKGLDAITAKISKDEMEGIPHYLLDVVKVGENFSVAKYQKLGYQILKKIEKSNRKVANPLLPIIVGGTGLYVAAVADGYEFVDVAPNLKLRAKLAKLDLEQLQKELVDLDPETTVDIKNPRRIIRALEILSSGINPKPRQTPLFDVLKIGILRDNDEIKRLIQKRITGINLDKLLAEARLIAKSASNRSNPLSTYYKPAIAYLSDEISESQMLIEMAKADLEYAKRQMTWFKKDPSIHWVKTFRQAEQLLRKFAS